MTLYLYLCLCLCAFVFILLCTCVCVCARPYLYLYSYLYWTPLNIRVACNIFLSVLCGMDSLMSILPSPCCRPPLTLFISLCGLAAHRQTKIYLFDWIAFVEALGIFLLIFWTVWKLQTGLYHIWNNKIFANIVNSSVAKLHISWQYSLAG